MVTPLDEIRVRPISCETAASMLKTAESAGQLILESAREDLNREGLQKTPMRFAKAMRDLTSGYLMTPALAVGQGVFPSESKGLVSVKNVEFYSLCEHHLLPFWGKASVAYYPNQKILGLSKIPRIIDVFAKRFQVQERLTQQIGEAIVDLIDARAVSVKVDACHLCMMMRGVEKQSSNTVTEAHFRLESLTEIEKSRLWEALK